MTVDLYDHEPAVGEPLPGSPAASPSPEAAETALVPAYMAAVGYPRSPEAAGTAWAAVTAATADTAVLPAYVDSADSVDAAGLPVPAEAPAEGAEAAESTAAPVFVDSSGRRQRRVRRLGLLLAVPAAGYLCLLVSTVLGGPTVSAPFLPLPQPPAAAPAAPTPSDLGTERPDSVQPARAEPTTAAPHAGTPAARAGRRPRPSPWTSPRPPRPRRPPAPTATAPRGRPPPRPPATGARPRRRATPATSRPSPPRPPDADSLTPPGPVTHRPFHAARNAPPDPRAPGPSAMPCRASRLPASRKAPR